MPADPPSHVGSGAPLRIDVERTGPRAVVHVVGEIDVATAPQLRARLESVVDGGCLRVDVDLDAVRFCDLVGLDVLLATHARLRARQGRLVVHGECPPLRRLLDVLQLTDDLELAPLGSLPDRRADPTSADPTQAPT